MSTNTRISRKDRDSILQSLRAGVVPRRGLQHVQVGRAPEIEALVDDINRVAEGGSAVRFIIGEYGAGKTFFLHVVRSVALKSKLVTAHADLDPDRRLHSTQGNARSLYAELMRNVATASRPEGGGLPGVVERFITSALQAATATGRAVEEVIQERLHELAQLTGGYAFANVVAAYWRGHDRGDDRLKTAAIRWLRAEFGTKTEARAALGVRTIIDDGSFYDHLKLFSRFAVLAGYAGLLVGLDEAVNLYRMTSKRSRQANYEQMLRMVNDCLQGSAESVGFLFCGTPEFLTDTRRGVYSYEALRSRLAENTFAGDGLIDLSSPVIRLANLTPEDLYVLLRNLRNVQAGGEPDRHLVPDEALEAFLRHCSQRLGEAYFRTPRTTIKSFLDLLAVLEQNPQATWQDRLGEMEVSDDEGPDLSAIDDGEGDDEGLASFRL